jgi:hypothetical protein
MDMRQDRLHEINRLGNEAQNIYRRISSRASRNSWLEATDAEYDRLKKIRSTLLKLYAAKRREGPCGDPFCTCQQNRPYRQRLWKK